MYGFINFIILGTFVLYFKEIIVLNEKFLILVIFISFIIFIKNLLKEMINGFFMNINKELTHEIFLYEFTVDAKYSYLYLYYNLDLMRKRLFHKVYTSYIKSLNFLSIFYYNFIFRKKHQYVINNFETLMSDVYYYVIRKHLFIKLNFLYRSYYYIFYKFRTI